MSANYNWNLNQTGVQMPYFDPQMNYDGQSYDTARQDQQWNLQAEPIGQAVRTPWGMQEIEQKKQAAPIWEYNNTIPVLPENQTVMETPPVNLNNQTELYALVERISEMAVVGGNPEAAYDQLLKIRKEQNG